MGTVEQRAHPLAYEGLRSGLTHLWEIGDLLDAFSAFLDPLPAGELLRLPLITIRSWSTAAAKRASPLAVMIQGIIADMRPSFGAAPTSFDKRQFARTLLARRNLVLAAPPPPPEPLDADEPIPEDDPYDVDLLGEPEEITMLRMEDEEPGDAEEPTRQRRGWRPPSLLRGKRQRPQLPASRLGDALAFVFAFIVMGLQSHATTGFAHIWGRTPPSKADQFAVQPFICDEVTHEARSSVELLALSIPPGTIIASDGSWGHRRNSDQCFSAFIAITPDSEHPLNGKVVDFEVVERRFGQQKRGNYIGSSQAMETEALRRMVPRWIHNPNVVGFAHDQDAHAMALIRELGWNVKEYRDPNHVFKSNFERIFIKWNVEAAQPAPKGKGMAGRRKFVLTGLKEKLRSHLKHCAYTDFPDEDSRMRCWMGAFDFFVHPTGQTGLWALRANETSQEHLRGFLDEMVPYVRAVQTRINTQMCESLNSLKGKSANKNISFSASWAARCAAAVLRMNEGWSWIPPLRESVVQAPLAPEAIDWVNREHEERQSRIAQRKTEEARAERYQSRAATAQRKKDESARGRQGEGHEPSVDSSWSDPDVKPVHSRYVPVVVVPPAPEPDGDFPEVAVERGEEVLPGRKRRQPNFDPRSEMVDGGLQNSGVLCHFNAVVEVIINLPLLRGALMRCGAHPVIDEMRKLVEPRERELSVRPLLRRLYSDAPAALWRDCRWFKEERDPAATMGKLVSTFAALPDWVGLPVAALFTDQCEIVRVCGECHAAVGDAPVAVPPPGTLISRHHLDAEPRTPEQWVAGVRTSRAVKCAKCGYAGASSFAFSAPAAQELLVFDFQGIANTYVAVPDVIPGRPSYRLSATVNWSGSGHVVALVRELGFGETWRRYDDARVEPEPGPLSRGGMRAGPFKLVFYARMSASVAHVPLGRAGR
jgi:hypothetical protein